MSLITIKQLLESVDLDFEPRFVTKDKNGMIKIFEHRPKKADYYWLDDHPIYGKAFISFIKLAEFEGKDWTECIYEVPRKTTGKIEKIEVGYNNSLKAQDWQDIAHTVANKINELVNAVNELKGAN